MNLYELLDAVEGKKIPVEFFEYKESKYSVDFKPHTVVYKDEDDVEYTFLSLVFKEWEDTFYITAQDAENNLEFFRCFGGEAMKVEVND